MASPTVYYICIVYLALDELFQAKMAVSLFVFNHEYLRCCFKRKPLNETLPMSTHSMSHDM